MRNNVNTLVNKVVFSLSFTLVVTVTLSSCRSKKALVKEDKTVAVPSQTAGSQSDKNNKEQQRQLLQQQFVKKVADNAVYNKCITSKIDFNLKSDKKDISVSGRLQMRRDDVIRIQLNVPLLGMEAGRLEFTKDYVMIVDRIHTEYIKGDYNQIDFLKNNGLDFYALQALFWNQLYMPGSAKIDNAALKNFEVTMNEGTANSMVSLLRDNMNYQWHVDNVLGLIRQVDVTYSSRQHGATKVTCTYDDFKSVGVKQFPSDLVLDMNTSATKKPRQMKMSIHLRGVNTDEKWDARTNLSKKYKEVKPEEALKKLMSL